MPEKEKDPLADLNLKKVEIPTDPPVGTTAETTEGTATPPVETPTAEPVANPARTQAPAKRAAIARVNERRRGWQRSVPAEYDPNVPAPEPERFVRVRGQIDEIRTTGGKLYNKETFFRGGIQSSAPRLDEIQAANLRGTGNPGTHTREEIALEILTKAGVDKLYPELVFPLAEALEPILAEQEVAVVKARAGRRNPRR